MHFATNVSLGWIIGKKFYAGVYDCIITAVSALILTMCDVLSRISLVSTSDETSFCNAVFRL